MDRRDASKKTVAVFGAYGLLGSNMYEMLTERGYRVVPCSRLLFSFLDENQLELLKNFNPEILINCAGYTNVGAAETSKELCTDLNVMGVRNLVGLAQDLEIPLIHFSTDYVFDGAKGEPYLEDDAPNPLNHYGLTKMLGENVVLEELPDSGYVARVSWLFGEGRQTFPDFVADRARDGLPVRVVKDQLGRTTYTKDIAASTVGLIEGDYEAGVYHMVNEGDVTRPEIAAEVLELLDLPRTIEQALATDVFTDTAVRPSYSVLENTKLPLLPHWKDALRAYFRRGNQ